MTESLTLPGLATSPSPEVEPRPGSRAARMNMPIAKGILEDLAREYGVCLKPVVLRRVDTDTGACEIIEVPCGARLASKCAPCAERNRKLRMQQIRQGWHLADEPHPGTPPGIG